MNDKQRVRLVKALEAFGAGVEVAKDMVNGLRPAKEVLEHIHELTTELEFIAEQVDKHVGADHVIKKALDRRAENPT